MLQAISQHTQREHLGSGEGVFPRRPVRHHTGGAREQGTRAHELRAATSLARLWRDQGKRAEARDLLALVYGWFTERFDTRDLIEAKAMLDERR